MVQLIQEKYRDSSVIIRTKAPNLLFLLLIILGFLPVTIATDLLRGHMLPAILQLIVMGFIGIALLFLVKGDFSKASRIPLYASVVLVTALSFVITPRSIFQSYTLALYMMVPLVFTLVVSERSRETLHAMLLGVVMIPLAAMTRLYLNLEVELAEILGPLVTAEVLYLVLGFFAYRVARVSTRAMVEMELNSQKNLEVLNRIIALMEDSRGASESLHVLDQDFTQANASIKAIFQEVESLNQGTEGLRISVDKINSSLKNTASMAQGFDGQVEEQNTVVLESTAAVNQMAASLDSVAGITQEKKKASDHLLDVAGQGVLALQETNKSLQEANRQMKELLEINKIVGSIAAQTNLLSMNAAIEAAHAGESGRGFAVVADEIRKLAGNTAKNSRIIASDVKQLLASLDETTAHASKTDLAMKEIMEEIRAVSDAFNEITHSTRELSNGGREILKAMELLQRSSLNIREGSDEITQEQKKANQEMEGINQVASRLAQATNQVDQSLKTINEALQHLSGTIRESLDRSQNLQDSITGLTDSL